MAWAKAVGIPIKVKVIVTHFCRERQQLREQLEHEQATGKAQYTVLAHCALRAGAGADTECQAGSKQREILGVHRHVAGITLHGSSMKLLCQAYCMHAAYACMQSGIDQPILNTNH